MARGKKKETLTPEERLQAALVPVSEQPYPVPENWCWTRMENIAQWGSGGTPSRKIPEYYNGDIPWIKTGELNDDYIFETEEHITEEAISHSSAKLFPVNTVAIAMYGATIGKVGILGVAATTNQACACGVSNSLANYKYLFYYARSQKDNFIKKGKGGAQPNISQEIIKSHEFPLPPLSEQHRIVDRIESLFAKLDEARQKAQDALDSFETRKAAILHRAFTGELTARWRKERGIGMDSWERLKLGEIGTLERGRSQHRPRNDPRLFGGPYPFIQTGDVASANVYITEHHQTLSEFGMEQSRMFSAETLCITIAANIGDVAILSYDCCFPDSVVGFIPNNRSISKFVYYMMSVLQKELEDNAPATAQKNINLKILNAVEMNIPPVIEQAEIVRRLDNLLAKERQAKENAEKVLEQIDLIQKAILARAFRGELGTNDPSEESAVELVKRVLAVEPPPEARAKAVSIPREVEKQLKCELERKIMKLYYYSDSRSLPINTLMEVSSKKFEVLESIRNLEQRGIIKKLPNGNYKLVR